MPTAQHTTHQDTSLSDVVKLTQALVRCKSITPSPERTFDVLKPLLETLGFTVHLHQIKEVTNLFATQTFGATNTHKPHLLFLGHTDVVPANAQEWTHPPFEGVIKDGILWGRGTADMKGAIAAFVCATQTFLAHRKEQSDTLQGTLSLLLTSDEEGPALNGTRAMIPWLQQNHKTLLPGHTNFEPTLCLVGEPSSSAFVGDTLKIGRRGSLTGSLTVLGKSGHSAYPSNGQNPLPRLLKTLSALLNTQHTLESDFWEGQLDQGYKDDSDTLCFEPTTFTLTGLESPFIASNVTPPTAKAFFSIRFNPHHTGHSLRQRIEKVSSRHAGKHILDININGEPYLTRDFASIHKVQKSVADSLRERGTECVPQLSTTGGTSDGRFISALCPVIELGLLSKTIHKANEHVALQDLKTLQAHYTKILNAFFV
ncbi:MAG: succinyl-diaminopimelate desuccinylase [Holosporaceae bacterium]